MLKFGNKEFRNLQEQVEENMKDIEKLKSGQAVLDEFGIKVVGEVSDIEDLPTVAEYKESTPDWEYGDTFAVGTDAPYTLYILTRANGTHEADYWFDIGVFPAPGPQGEEGPQGQTGPQGPTGPSGADGAAAGFGTPTASAYTLGVGQAPRVEIATSGPNTEKVFDFTFYIPVGEAEVTITGSNLTGTLTQTEYNKLDNYDNSIIKFHASEYLNYFLKKWYRNADYLVFIGLSGYETLSTSVYKCVIDRTTRAYTMSVLQPIKINKGNISSKINSETNETAGKVLTADGSGGASWEDAAAGMEVVSLTSYPGTLSDANYAILNSDNGLIKYTEYGVSKYFKKQSDDGTYIYYFDVDVDNGTWWGGFKITKSNKYYNRENTYLNITSSNIKTGSLVAGQFLKSNGSGGSTWGDGPSQVQSDWNQTSQSSPAYIKNKPTIPTVPVTDVTVNGTSVLDGTTAKVLVDTVDGTSDGTNWTSITINGTAAAIPAAQVQANWNESDNTDPSYIQNKPSIPAAQVNSDWNAVSGVAQILNKPDLSIYAQSSSLATVATSGDYDDLLNKPTIPAAQVQSDWDQSDNTAVDYIKNKPTIPVVSYPVTDVEVDGVSVLNGTVAEITMPTVPTSASSSSSSTSTVTSTTSAFVTGVTPTSETWTFGLSDGTTVNKTVILSISASTDNAMTGATVATTTTTTTTLS